MSHDKNCIKTFSNVRVSSSDITGASSLPQGLIGDQKSKERTRPLIHNDAIILLDSSATQCDNKSWCLNAVRYTAYSGLKGILLVRLLTVVETNPRDSRAFSLLMLHVHFRTAGVLCCAL